MNEKPERYDEAVELVKERGKVRITYLQRKMRIGYVWAARIVDQMEQDGLIGTPEKDFERPYIG